ncbi:hypothetical protein JD292_01880 [Leucobacter sp. CSA2]|uniref:DUF6457 domain-containing protein n=1 Tax=Leucobacter edaphi TaxID=2796472 RepID=A0A934UWS1_9MICO|nr:DUF6457 domain-containing protein [Leucobacter edaphi]MBK0420831.1 hypothetical protein [Leucobacter edaphi]
MTQNTYLPPEALEEWLAASAAELGVDPSIVSIATVLDVARDVAHDVARPAAPLTTFLLGVAFAQGAHGRDESVEGATKELRALAAKVTGLASTWQPAAGGAEE